MTFNPHDLNSKCSKHFTYADYIQCGETQNRLQNPKNCKKRPLPTKASRILIKMHMTHYFESIKNIKLGKHLPSAVYLHKEALSHVDNPLVDLLQETNMKDWGIEAAWNVVKFHKKQPRISLLYYPQFFEDVLKRTAFPVAPGVFFAFKDDEWEQRFLVAKEQLLQSWTKLSYTAHPEKLKIRQKALFERHKELFESYFETCQKLGRPPKDIEFAESQDLRLYCGSTNKAINLVTEIYGQEAFKHAHNRRTEDLLVFFALIFFGRRSPFNHFPPDLKADISYFFNGYTNALDQAKVLLFSIGKPENIRKACLADSARLKTGFLEGEHSFTIHKNRLNELTPLLRVYIGCARMLYGDLDSVDLIKIHMTSGKVTFLMYDQFEEENEPLLIERIKVNLRHQNIDFFKYGDQFPSTPLLNKGCY